MKLIKRFIFIILLMTISIPSTIVTANDINHSANPLKVNKMPLPEKFSERRTEPITHIMIHSISNVVSKPNSPYSIIDIYLLLMEYGVSTHYVIARDGEVFQLVADNRVAYHAGKSGFPYLPFFPHNMNQFSIGIEVMGIGTRDEMDMLPDELYHSLNKDFIGFTEEQYNSLWILLNQLCERYPSIHKNRNYIIGHEDYAPGRKNDPGSLFEWERIRLKNETELGEKTY